MHSRSNDSNKCLFIVCWQPPDLIVGCVLKTMALEDFSRMARYFVGDICRTLHQPLRAYESQGSENRRELSTQETRGVLDHLRRRMQSTVTSRAGWGNGDAMWACTANLAYSLGSYLTAWGWASTLD